MIVFAALLFLSLMAAPAAALEMSKLTLDLSPYLTPYGAKKEIPEPLFRQMLLADLNGDGRKEIIVPANDGRLRVVRLVQSGRQMQLQHWTTINTRTEGEQPGPCHFTAGRLEPGAKSDTLALAIARGVFSMRIEGAPPVPRLRLLSERPFFDTTELANPRRVDFLTDLDGDGVDEFWMPQADGMAFFRRAGQDALEPIPMPPIAKRVRQSFGARSAGMSAVQPALYDLDFSSSLQFPRLQVMDLDRDGRQELVAVRYESGRQPLLRAECYGLGRDGRFTSAPTQIRIAKSGEGNQAFLDLNGDGRLDLLRVESNLDIVRPRTAVSLFFSPAAREYTFDKPTRRYLTHDPIGLVLYGDWNRDGLADLAFSQFQYSFGSTDDLIDMVLGRQVTVTLHFIWGRPGEPATKPDQSLTVDIRNRCFSHDLFPPVSMEGDFNGDGAADLLLRSQLDRASVYLSQNKGARLADRPAASFTFPEDSGLVIADIDGDGKSDVVATPAEKAEMSVYLSR
jgi:hypothetical protein